MIWPVWRRAKVALLTVALAGLLPACTGSEHLQGRARASAWASARGWTPVLLPAEPFSLLALLRQEQSTARLTVYIEGDGAAWPSAYQPPRDPTPRQPLGLLLAERDPSTSTAYLARPCQYLPEVELQSCSSLYWRERRFAPEVLRAMDQAVSRLKQRAGAQRLRLVGYSGGGVLATLLAQRRGDVDSLITLAAPLALVEWARSKQLAPLRGSLDPLAGPGPLPHAVHFIGSLDPLVPLALSAEFVARHGGRQERLEGFDHACCWLDDWPALLTRAEDGR